MKKLILITAILLSSCGGDLGEGKHHISGVIIEVGSCGAGDDDYEIKCAVKVKTNGRIEYWQVYGPQIKGKTIYKQCWIEDDGVHCFVNASNYPGRLYKMKYEDIKQ